MAATAHAFVVSLMNTMDQIQTHPSLSACFDHHQFNTLRENVDFFLDFLEKYSHIDSKEIEDLVRRIGASAHEAEDKIEVEAADRMRSGSTRKSLKFLGENVDFFLDAKTIEMEDQEAHRMRSGSTRKRLTFLFVLHRLIQDMNSIKEKVIKLKEETGLFTNSMPPPSSLSSFAPTATKKTKMVGFEGHVAQLLDELTSSNSGRRILPIVGMGGIGKTTLARNVYENSVILHHFDARAWVNVSQNYDATDILSQALSCLGGFKSRNDTCGDEVGEKLRKILYGRRYLIVLDDVWSVEAWEKIQFSFPDNNNGSRIVVTTRQQEVVDYFASSALAPNFLDDKISWELFCDETFGEEGCPPELQVVGRNIVEKCKGLPLAINVIGGLLGKSPRTPEYWEKIAQDRSLILEGSSEGIQVLSILYLSYKFLPVWLRSCFLYLGLFPEDHRIKVSQLIKLLVAEGYIKANGKQSLEEVTKSYVRELVDRNLLLVGDLSLNKVLITCYLHDLVRELCIRIAEKEDFYCVQRSMDGSTHYIVDQRTARSYAVESPPIPTSVIRPKIVHGQIEAPFKSRLLRVCVDVDSGSHYDIFHQFSLRYLFHNRSYLLPIPWSLSLCWSLQTLKLSSRCTLPSEIWTMPQLRHIKASGYMYILDPPKDNNAIALNNLLTLKTVEKLNFTEELCRRIPNIKHLGIDYDFDINDGVSWCFNLHNVGCLKKLEVLRFVCKGVGKIVGNPVQNLTLPTSLRKLTLSGCRLVWSHMAMVASLPHLQILELLVNAVVGAQWNCAKVKFCCLKHLRISRCDDLSNWIAKSSNFPVLETLSLHQLSNLKKIPSGIGHIATLENMYLYYCRQSVAMSAVKIVEEQEYLGNQGLQLKLKPDGRIGQFGFQVQDFPRL